MSDDARTRAENLLEEIAQIRQENTSYRGHSDHTQEEELAFEKRDRRLLEILGELTGWFEKRPN